MSLFDFVYSKTVPLKLKPPIPPSAPPSNNTSSSTLDRTGRNM